MATPCAVFIECPLLGQIPKCARGNILGVFWVRHEMERVVWILGVAQIFYFVLFLGCRALLLWAYAHAMRRLLSSAPFCVHSPHYDTTRIFARAHQVRAPLKIMGMCPRFFNFGRF